MHYNMLKSIVHSQKDTIELSNPSHSFFIKPERVNPYIDPAFSKVEFPRERPSILLVSAVGASGKTTTAHALSFDTQLPILDLAKHKAVGDNTLTGVLTNSYATDTIGQVLQGLRMGTHGVIIDGIDEGRSKTTGQGFEAFLDDLMKLSRDSATTTIVIFGRNPVLFSTWCYLVENDADVGMVQIDPFTQKQAEAYIDSHLVGTLVSGQRESYEQARDALLAKLNAAFLPDTRYDERVSKSVFLSFIGYPPVLDAIVTLLRKERNYHRLQNSLNNRSEGNLEAGLLVDISDYLLDRERDEKAVPNFIEDIAHNAGGALGQGLLAVLYNREEQCARVLSEVLDRPFPCRLIQDDTLNEQYENNAEIWCKGHPFLEEERIRVRNGVFSALAIARCTLSPIREYQELALDYAAANRPTYHLLLILDELAKKEQRQIDARAFNMLIQSSSEFLGINADIMVDICGDQWEVSEEETHTEVELGITIDFPEDNQERIFEFQGTIASASIPLGPYLVNTSVTLPCGVELLATSAIEVLGPSSISAQYVHIDSPDLVLRDTSRRKMEDVQKKAELFINTQRASGHVDKISLQGGDFEIQCEEHNLGHPLAKHARKQVVPLRPTDPMFMRKYMRLRRILSDFASHKRGRLAKYRRKIEHGRVLPGLPWRAHTASAYLKTSVREGFQILFCQS